MLLFRQRRAARIAFAPPVRTVVVGRRRERREQRFELLDLPVAQHPLAALDGAERVHRLPSGGQPGEGGPVEPDLRRETRLGGLEGRVGSGVERGHAGGLHGAHARRRRPDPRGRPCIDPAPSLLSGARIAGPRSADRRGTSATPSASPADPGGRASPMSVSGSPPRDRCEARASLWGTRPPVSGGRARDGSRGGDPGRCGGSPALAGGPASGPAGTASRPPPRARTGPPSPPTARGPTVVRRRGVRTRARGPWPAVRGCFLRTRSARERTAPRHSGPACGRGRGSRPRNCRSPGSVTSSSRMRRSSSAKTASRSARAMTAAPTMIRRRVSRLRSSSLRRARSRFRSAARPAIFLSSAEIFSATVLVLRVVEGLLSCG